MNYRKDGSTFLNQFFLSPIKVSSTAVVIGYALGSLSGRTCDGSFMPGVDCGSYLCEP